MATTITADEALQRLMEGNVRYIEGTPARPNQDKGRLMEVAKGQKPFAIILGCADSRVPAEILFDQGIGDIFVVRVAGNVAQDPTVIASLEFAVGALGGAADYGARSSVLWGCSGGSERRCVARSSE